MPNRNPGPCSIEGCHRPARARTWCVTHYTRWARHGDPVNAPSRPSCGMTTEGRFWIKVNKSDGCWVWIASKDANGYGKFNDGRQNVLAHRFAYGLVLGSIPVGAHLDHACHNTSCVRPHPEHVRAVTRKQNMEHRRGAQKNNLSSGIRGVSWSKEMKRWEAHVTSNGKKYVAGYFADINEAAEAARLKRNELFTHNDVDRKSA